VTFFYADVVTSDRNTDETQFLILFGNRLRAIRTRRGLTQEETAHLAGFSRSYYTEIETGKRNISLLNLNKLAQCLEIGLPHLVDIGQDDATIHGS
jgi:transcriptional regulator with XRE-family HTH domain